MKTDNYPPTAEHKRWFASLADGGCLITGSPIVQIHHIYGASAKHNGIWIGHWAVLPLHPDLHDISSKRPDNVTTNRREFEWRHGKQAELYRFMCDRRRRAGQFLPDEEIIQAILSFQR